MTPTTAPLTAVSAADPDEVSPEEAALVARVSTYTIARWIKAGRLIARHGYRGRVRVRTDSLQALIAAPRSEG